MIQPKGLQNKKGNMKVIQQKMNKIKRQINFVKNHQKYLEQNCLHQERQEQGQKNVFHDIQGIDQPHEQEKESKKNLQEQQSQNQQYTTSINELISQPILQSIYSVEYIFSSLYQLSEYLFTKKIQQSSPTSSLKYLEEQSNHQISFDSYLKQLQQEMTKYDKFKKTKAKQEQLYFYQNNQRSNTQSKFQQYPNQKSFNLMQKPKKNKKILNLESQLIRCYQKVPYIFFQQNFSLDFSNFEDKDNRLKYNNIQKMKQSQQTMNDDLDLIQINLFAQIHRKFQDYFKAAANFDYLRESIIIQLCKLKQSRSRIARVQKEFVVKSQKLRKKIIQRTNYEKIIKKIQILKSLKKLPSLIQSILQSEFPFDCLSFLKQIKNSISQVQTLSSTKQILDNIKSCQTIVQFGLNKRYTDQLYLYMEQVFNLFDFTDKFKKITNEANILSKDNNSINSISRRSNNQQSQSFRERSGIFMFDDLMAETKNQNFGGKSLLKNSIAKRNQAKQYEISMILLQSYEYINFPVDVTKIKITNGLRVISKKFEKDLLLYLKTQIQKAKQKNQKSFLYNSLLISQKTISIQQSIHQEQINKSYEEKELQKAIQEVSIEVYTKLLFILNDLFKQTINRYLDYVMTLLTEYQQKLAKIISQIESRTKKSLEPGSDHSISLNHISSNNLSDSNVKILQKSQKMSQMESSNNKFKQILSEQLALLPSIFKILQQKLNHFLTLKNISTVSPQQFYQWISLLRFWQKWFDTLTEESCLLNYSCSLFTSQTEIGSQNQLFSIGQDMIEENIGLVLENVKKSFNTINIKNRITQLTISYLTNYCSSISLELHQGIMQESWQSIEIPQQFSDVINNIISKPIQNNLQLTILNSSTSKGFRNVNRNTEDDDLKSSQSDLPFKYKILKNNILIEGQRYKLTCSFLLLCQFIEELIKVGYLFMAITSECDQSLDSLNQSKHVKKIFSCLYEKIYQLVDSYNKECKEMILEKKVLKLEKIKGNNITVKHICLLSNCLTFLEKITKQIPIKDFKNLLGKKQRKIQVLYNLANHNILLVEKISSILNKKVQSLILIIKQQERASNIQALILQSNQSIVTVFLQITEIIDDCLDFDKCEKILKQPFQLFVQKYFKLVVMKGDKYFQELSLLLQKLKFLKKYFKNEFISMLRQLQQ